MPQIPHCSLWSPSVWSFHCSFPDSGAPVYLPFVSRRKLRRIWCCTIFSPHNQHHWHSEAFFLRLAKVPWSGLARNPQFKSFSTFHLSAFSLKQNCTFSHNFLFFVCSKKNLHRHHSMGMYLMEPGCMRQRPTNEFCLRHSPSKWNQNYKDFLRILSCIWLFGTVVVFQLLILSWKHKVNAVEWSVNFGDEWRSRSPATSTGNNDDDHSSSSTICLATIFTVSCFTTQFVHICPAAWHKEIQWLCKPFALRKTVSQQRR